LIIDVPRKRLTSAQNTILFEVYGVKLNFRVASKACLLKRKRGKRKRGKRKRGKRKAFLLKIDYKTCNLQDLFPQQRMDGISSRKLFPIRNDSVNLVGLLVDNLYDQVPQFLSIPFSFLAFSLVF
jgi:hypothetical protein